MIPPDPFADVLILTGPTASGKTGLALDLAERLNAEIIAMDSMTLYRGMDIGTAKPTPNERARVPHHLLDILDPWESGNVAWWLREAERVCQNIQSRGKQVLFVGGTPFYLKALLHGLFESPPTDLELRARLEDEARAVGPERFHAQLREIDPVSAQRLHPNDVRRVVRAFEVWHLTGKPLSVMQRQGWFGSDGDSKPSKYFDDFPRCLALDLPRHELYARIDHRVEIMIEAGWIDEVRQLRALPQPLSKEAAHALGYRVLGEVLDGTMSLREAIALIQMRTRQFAKRQLTWFRGLPGCQLCQGKLTFDLWRRRMS